MQMDVKPNLYASLDIIPEIGMDRSKPWSNHGPTTLKTDSYIIKLVQNGPKWSEMVKTIESG